MRYDKNNPAINVPHGVDVNAFDGLITQPEFSRKTSHSQNFMYPKERKQVRKPRIQHSPPISSNSKMASTAAEMSSGFDLD